MVINVRLYHEGRDHYCEISNGDKVAVFLVNSDETLLVRAYSPEFGLLTFTAIPLEWHDMASDAYDREVARQA